MKMPIENRAPAELEHTLVHLIKKFVANSKVDSQSADLQKIKNEIRFTMRALHLRETERM